MRFLRGVLPNLSIALNICLVVVVYLDRRNPMMGFLFGAPFFTLVAATAVVSVATAAISYYHWRKTKKRRHKAEKTAKDT